MGKLISSKWIAWLAFFIVVAVIVLCFFFPGFKQYWWQTFDLFFAFQMVFCHLASLYLARISPSASSKLDIIAFIFGILAIISFLVIFIINQFI